jgi:hypothetical protein
MNNMKEVYKLTVYQERYTNNIKIEIIDKFKKKWYVGTTQLKEIDQCKESEDK